jgi:hypothetical protein
MVGPFEIFVLSETAQVTDICYCYSDQSDFWEESPERIMLVVFYSRKVAFVSECVFSKETLKMKGKRR